jgi:hypothetical protein
MNVYLLAVFYLVLLYIAHRYFIVWDKKADDNDREGEIE